MNWKLFIQVVILLLIVLVIGGAVFAFLLDKMKGFVDDDR